MLTLNDECMAGLTQADCDLVNQAVAALVARGYAEPHAEDIAVNNWRLLHENSVGSLTCTSSHYNGKF